MTTLYVGGGGDNNRYVGGGDGGSDALFSLGCDAGERIWGEDVDEDLDEDLLYICFWHSSRRCRCSRFFDENTFSHCLQDGLLHIFSCVCRIRRAVEEKEALQSLQ